MFREVVQELLAAYRDLRRHLAHELRNTDDAADIAQSSFERVYTRATATAGGMDAIEFPRALLFHTARNLCIDAGRHRQIERAWLAASAAEHLEAAAPSAEQVASQRQLVARVAALLDELPPRRRDVFVLFKVYGYSREEIAGRLGITEAAVAKHVVRATLDCAAGLTELAGQGSGRTDTHAATALVGPQLAGHHAS